MRKIYLYKIFEKAWLTKQSIIICEKENNKEEFIIISVENLNEKKQEYYNILDDFCRFKNNKNRSVVSVNFGGNE